MKEKKSLQEISLNLQRTGMKRRKKEVRNIRVMALLSVIFLTLTVLFSENMKEYQREMNFHSYGEWFMCQPDGFPEISNAYLEKAGTISVGSELFCLRNGKEDGRAEVKISPYEKGNVDTGIFLGSLDDASVRMGNIRLYEGRMPERGNEIAMELSVLQTFGYNYEIGQTVSVYITRDNWERKRADDEEVELYRMDFQLVGTIKSYTAHWACGENMPGAVVSAETYEKIEMDKKSYTFFQIKEQYKEVDAQRLKKGIFDDLDKRMKAAGVEERANNVGYCSNDFAYTDSFWGNWEMYRNMLLFLMVTGAAALAYLMSSYLSGRRVFYYKLRSIGATAMQIRGMALYECAYSVFFPSMIAIALSYLLSVVVVWGVAMAADLPFFYVFHWRTLGLVLGSVFTVLLVSTVTAIVMLGAKRIEEKRKALSPRRLRRLGKRAARRKRLIGSGEFLCREHLQHPFSVLFRRLLGILVCTVVLCCMAKIYESVVWYNLATMRLADYSLWVPQDEGIISDEDIEEAADGDDDGTHTLQYSNRKRVLPDSLLKTLEEQIGIQSIRYLVHDYTHIFDWKDKQKSNLWEKNLIGRIRNITEGEKGVLVSDELVCSEMYSASYYKDCKTLWKELKKHLDMEIADYDKICEGRQVILFLNDYEGLMEDIQNSEEENEAENKAEKKRDDYVLDLENTLKVGDTLQIRTKGKPVSVEIAGILDSQEMSWYAGNSVYNILGSETLGRAVAEADSEEFGYTDLEISLNRLASGEATGKVITRLCTLNGLEYDSNMEIYDFYFQNVIQKVFVYGTLAVIILVIYLFISFCIRQEERRKKEPGRQQLHLMGMSAKQLCRMEWREGLREEIILWISVLFYGVVQAVQLLGEWEEFDEEVISQYVAVLGKYISIYGVKEYIFYNLLDSLSVWWLIIFMLGMAAVVILLYSGGKAESAKSV